MKPGTAKTKGTATETKFVDWLKPWVPFIERRRLAGTHDRGDIAGLPGVVIEIKSGAKINLPGWLKELRVEMANDRADMGAVVIRLKGRPHPDLWVAAMPLPLWRELMIQAGWIDEPVDDVGAS